MQASRTTRHLVGTTLLASAVLALSSAAPPVTDGLVSAPRAERREPRAVQIFEKHQLALRDSIVRVALAQVGTRYEYGGTTPVEGFDCSGLVRFVYSQLYLTPPRLAAKQARAGAAIRRDRLLPGDLVAFGTGDTVTHIGIYVGDRKFVHASSVAGQVIVSAIDRPPHELIKPLKGARRLLAITEPTVQRLGGN